MITLCIRFAAVPGWEIKERKRCWMFFHWDCRFHWTLTRDWNNDFFFIHSFPKGLCIILITVAMTILLDFVTVTNKLSILGGFTQVSFSFLKSPMHIRMLFFYMTTSSSAECMPPMALWPRHGGRERLWVILGGEASTTSPRTLARA